jgi:hypothetical protein
MASLSSSLEDAIVSVGVRFEGESTGPLDELDDELEELDDDDALVADETPRSLVVSERAAGWNKEAVGWRLPPRNGPTLLTRLRFLSGLFLHFRRTYSCCSSMNSKALSKEQRSSS